MLSSNLMCSLVMISSELENDEGNCFIRVQEVSNPERLQDIHVTKLLEIDYTYNDQGMKTAHLGDYTFAATCNGTLKIFHFKGKRGIKANSQQQN
jgi:hypothetical protein